MRAAARWAPILFWLLSAIGLFVLLPVITHLLLREWGSWLSVTGTVFRAIWLTEAGTVIGLFFAAAWVTYRVLAADAQRTVLRFFTGAIGTVGVLAAVWIFVDFTARRCLWPPWSRWRFMQAVWRARSTVGAGVWAGPGGAAPGVAGGAADRVRVCRRHAR